MGLNIAWMLPSKNALHSTPAGLCSAGVLLRALDCSASLVLVAAAGRFQTAQALERVRRGRDKRTSGYKSLL